MNLSFITNIQLIFETWPMVFYSVILCLGLTVGSFLNVVIYRIPVMMRREFKDACVANFKAFQPTSVPTSKKAQNKVAIKPCQRETFNLALPGSSCLNCGHRIKTWENIPVISWLLLKGKCSACKISISWRYPAIEILTGLLSVAMAWHIRINILTLFALIFLWSLIALTFIDLDEMILPDQITIPLPGFGLLLSLNGYFVKPTDAILGAALGYLSLWSIFWCFKLITGKEGMGYGDFKLLAALGAFVGYAHLPVVIIISSFVGAFFGIAMILLKPAEDKLYLLAPTLLLRDSSPLSLGIRLWHCIGIILPHRKLLHRKICA